MIYLKQSTAYTAQIGPFIDDTDGFTPETGLTISQADVRLSKAGAVFAQKTDATSATHDENGWYRCPLDTTDTATLGALRLSVQESGALPVFMEFMVLVANVFDTFFGSDNLDVILADTDHTINTLTINATTGNALTVTSSGGNGNAIDINGNGSGDGINILAGTTGNGIDTTGGSTSGNGMKITGGAAASEGLVVESTSLHATRFTSTGGNGQGLRLVGNGTGNGVIAIGGVSGTGISGDMTGDITGTIDTCTTNTDMRGTDNALLAASAPTNFSSMGINSTGNVAISWGQVGSAGSTVGLTNTTVGVTTVNTDMRGTDNAGLAVTLIEMQGAGFDSATDSLKAIRDNIGSTSASVIADRNWNFATRILTANTNLEGLEVDMTKMAGSALSETSNGNIAGNLSTFYNNTDSLTIKTVDDVGGGAATVPPSIR